MAQPYSVSDDEYDFASLHFPPLKPRTLLKPPSFLSNHPHLENHLEITIRNYFSNEPLSSSLPHPSSFSPVLFSSLFPPSSSVLPPSFSSFLQNPSTSSSFLGLQNKRKGFKHFSLGRDDDRFETFLHPHSLESKFRTSKKDADSNLMCLLGFLAEESHEPTSTTSCKDYIISECGKIVLEFRLATIISLRYSSLLRSLLKRLENLERFFLDDQQLSADDPELPCLTRPKSNSKRSPKNPYLESVRTGGYSPMISSVSSFSNMNLGDVGSPAFRGREGGRTRGEMKGVASVIWRIKYIIINFLYWMHLDKVMKRLHNRNMTNSGGSPRSSVFSSHCVLESIGNFENDFKNCIKEIQLKKVCENNTSNPKLTQILTGIMNSKISASEEEFSSRKESLQRYLGWKFKTWGSTIKKIQYNQKRTTLFLNKISCKICGTEVLFKDFEGHSSFCRTKEELDQNLQKNNAEIDKTLEELEKNLQDLSLKFKLKNSSLNKLKAKIDNHKNRDVSMIDFRPFLPRLPRCRKIVSSFFSEEELKSEFSDISSQNIKRVCSPTFKDNKKRRNSEHSWKKKEGGGRRVVGGRKKGEGGSEEEGRRDTEGRKMSGRVNGLNYLGWPIKWLEIRRECEEIGRRLEMAEKVKEAASRMLMGRGGEGGEVKRLMDLKKNEKILESLSDEIHQTSLLPRSDSLTNLILSFISLLRQNISYLKQLNRLSRRSTPSCSPLFIPIKTIEDYLLPPSSPLPSSSPSHVLHPSSSTCFPPTSSSRLLPHTSLPPLSIFLQPPSPSSIKGSSPSHPSSFLLRPPSSIIPPNPSSLLRERLLGFTKSETNSPVDFERGLAFGEESVSPAKGGLNRKSRFYRKKSRGRGSEEENKSTTFIELSKEALMDKTPEELLPTHDEDEILKKKLISDFCNLANKQESIDYKPGSSSHSYSSDSCSSHSSSNPSSHRSKNDKTNYALDKFNENLDCNSKMIWSCGDKTKVPHLKNFDDMDLGRGVKHVGVKLRLFPCISEGFIDIGVVGREERKKEEKGGKIGIRDFEYLKIISKGAFGKVYIVRRKATKDIYAMKIVNFAEKSNKNHLDSLKKEKEILGVLNGDFVVKAHFTFSFEIYICFVMEYLKGGDLSSLLEKHGYFQEKVARFYIAELVLAVESLHNNGIIHRDLKPENILLDSAGHIKLIDFGLSKLGAKQIIKTNNKINFRRNNQKSEDSKTENSSSSMEKYFVKRSSQRKKFRILGTPDYIAPEILVGHGLDDKSVDWWSVGVVLFEFLIGIPPFNDESVDKIFDNIKNRRIPWESIPIGEEEEEGSIGLNAKNIIDQLLEINPGKRLGAGGADEIKKHPFFEGIDWSAIRHSEAPIIPVDVELMDTSNFSKESKPLDYDLIPNFGQDEILTNEGQNEMKIARTLLSHTNFDLKRVDLLFEQNMKVSKQFDLETKALDEKILKEDEELNKLNSFFKQEYGEEEEDEENVDADGDSVNEYTYNL